MGKGASADVIKDLEMRSSWIRVGFNPMTGVLIGGQGTQRRRPHEDRGRDWRGAAQAKGPRRASRTRGQETGTEGLAPHGTSPADCLVWDFCLQN